MTLNLILTRNPNPNLTAKQHVIEDIQLNIVSCPAYREKFIRDNVVAPIMQLFTFTEA